MKNSYLSTKKIGIWGYGSTGKSAADYFHKLGCNVEIIDQKKPSTTELQELETKNISFFEQSHIEQFLENNELILASPGIDLRAYLAYHNKWITELDIFHAIWQKPVVAITGSIGKTTITHLLSLILQHAHKNVSTGGNIGTPMLDLIKEKKENSMALLEVSSFQLEQCKEFAPDLSIITNIYPNHLDRHGSLHEYQAAKAKIMAYQSNKHATLIPWNLRSTLPTQAATNYFSATKQSSEDLNSIPADSKFFYVDDTALMLFHNGKTIPLIEREKLPTITFEDNWLIICAALNLLNVEIPDFNSISTITVPEHRLEKVAQVKGITFINDSKSTTPQSTMAAVNRLQKQPIMLLLGGLGKGIDRTNLILELKPKVKKIFCFGKEGKILKDICDSFAIENEFHETLDSAFGASSKQAQHGDQILLSPAGTSYDYYKNYIERGNHFKKMVLDFKDINN